MIRKINQLTVIRRIFQAALVAMVVFISIRHQVVGGGPRGSAALDTYCPFGGIETIYYYLQTGQFLEKTNISNFILLFAVIALALISGSAFCSWLCPFGTVQEWLAKLGRLLFGRNFTIPPKVHKYLRHLRYVVLALIVFLTVQGARLVFETYDPFKVLFHFNFETITAIVIFAVTIIMSILVDRFWCKYLCPLGAVMSLLGRFNLINIRRDEDKCIDCGLCTKSCYMDIKVDKETTVPAADCTKCLDCIHSCPEQGALNLTVGGGK